MEESSLLRQSIDLTKKNIKLFTNNPRYLFILALAPIIACLYVGHLESALTDVQSSFEKKEFPIENFEKIPKCKKPENCLTVGYYTFGPKKKWIDDIMEDFSDRAGLKYGKDVDFLGKSSPKKFQKLLRNQKNFTQTRIIFCTKTWDLEFDTGKFKKEMKKLQKILGKNILKKFVKKKNLKFQIPCTFDKLQKQNKKLVFYSIVYNNSLEFSNPYFVDQNSPYSMSKISFGVKKNLDEAIFNKFKDQKNFEENFLLNLTYQPYPKLGLKVKRDRSFITNHGSFFFSLSITVSQKKS